MGIKLKQFLFALDRHPVYRPGEVVTGACIVELDGTLDLSQLTIKLEGWARCQWDESYTTTDTDSEGNSTTTTHTNTISSSCLLIDLPYNPAELYPTVLSAGQHRFEFAFHLPTNGLPSSLEGFYGYIKYKLQARIHTPSLSFDKISEVEIKIQSPAYHSIPDLMQGVTNTATKSIGIFKKKSVTIDCHLPRSGCTIGDTIPVECFIDNHTKKSMELRATLKKFVHFYAEGQQMATRDKIVVEQGTLVQPKGTQKEVLSLLIPPTTVTSELCTIIKVTYQIVVTLVIKGHYDLHCELPLVITDEYIPTDKIPF